MPAPDQLGSYSFRSANGPEVSNVAQLVDAAYGHYIERIGRLPGPMSDDYAEVIRNRQVTLAESHGAIVGVIVLTVTDEGFLIDNVAVHPSHRGTGLGRAFLEFAEAEARRAGFGSIYLYTHEKMTENLALYSRIGYVEYDRREPPFDPASCVSPGTIADGVRGGGGLVLATAGRRWSASVPFARLVTTSLQRLRSRTGPLAWWAS
jgi:GNAT superfamily N-acetyltransferase